MNVNIDKFDLVEIEGLSEASVCSSDKQLFTVIDYLRKANFYSPSRDSDDETSPISQFLNACSGELARRHGSDFSYLPFVEAIGEKS